MADIILTNISMLKKSQGSQFKNYHTDDCGRIRGYYTNEAPVKYLLKTAYRNSAEDGCTIIAITTKEAEEAFTAFRKTIRRYCRRNGFAGLKIQKLRFDEYNFGSVINSIIRRIRKGDRIFIDTTGSFRNAAYLLMAVVRMLEYSGISLEKAVYSNDHKRRIEDVTKTYNMFNLINAANSFTSFGNSDELMHFFTDSSNSSIRSIIDVMSKFSDEVALCRTSKLDGLMNELNTMLNGLQSIQADDENEILFSSISGVIREKFRVEENGSIDYADVIAWCLDNKMIQQAVTIYAEKMPEFLLKSGLILFREDRVDRSNFVKTFDVYYNMLYNGFMRQLTSITWSPYPFANLLLRLKAENKTLYHDICAASNLDTLPIKSKLTPDERKGLQNLIRVRNAMFSETGIKRSQEVIKERKKNTKLRDFADSDIFSITATTPKALVNEILKNRDYLEMLQGEYAPHVPRVWNAADINVIEHLELMLSENNGQYRIAAGISLDDMRCVLRDLVYVKRYVRNSLNHASEISQVDREYNAYFAEHGYSVDAEPTVQGIETMIRNAIHLIRTLTQ